jgi:two-component system, NtrC family, nitrogen regulation sensor histidine kinase NtrY
MFQNPRGKKSVKRRSRSPVRFERRLLLSVLSAGLPAVLLGLVLLWKNPYSLDHQIEGTLAVLGLWLGLSVSARNRVVHSIRVLSAVVGALKEEDFSFRATLAAEGDALGDLAIEINNLACALEDQRLGAIETANLLQKVMTEAGAVVFAFSSEGKVRLVNRAGVAFLGLREDRILDSTAAELGITELLEGPPSGTVSWSVSGVERRWIVRRTHFRQHGMPHRLAVLSEASQALRAEERMAWQRIIRVLGHEINNSLAPIKSIARTLARIMSQSKLPPEFSENFIHGLDVIGSRAESLNGFLQSYAKLARLPSPAMEVVVLPQLVARVVSLESRISITVRPGPNVKLFVDPSQLEQALINLVRNAVDAFLMKENAAVDQDAVTISWAVGADLELWIRDRGIGLPNTENLFVPFYTTKATGSGIGLPLSRQIIESHGGSLRLRNRSDGIGCEAEIRLPIQAATSTFQKEPIRVG